MKTIISLTFFLYMLLMGNAVAVEDHHAFAVEHTNAAVSHGKAGHALILVEHAEEALKHAQHCAAGSTGGAKVHADAAVKALNEAIMHGKLGHASVATKAVEEANQHLNAVMP